MARSNPASGYRRGVAHLITSIARAASLNALAVNFVTERDGVAIATGSLVVHGRVALLAGASTIPSGRGLGAQGMLLAARLSSRPRSGSARTWPVS